MPTNINTPAYDNKIYQKYSKKTIENKLKNKEEFLKKVGVKFDKTTPVFCVTYPLTDKNNVGMIQDIMNGLIEQDLIIILVGIGNEKYQKYFTEIANKNSKKVIIYENGDASKRKIYSASDAILIPALSKECTDEAKNAMQYGVVPVIPEQNFVEDYNPNKEKGNAFVYTENSPWDMFAKVIRATESFRFPYDWKNIQKNAMKSE